MKKIRDAHETSSFHPLVAALLAGGALIGGASVGGSSLASPGGGTPATYVSLNGPSGFLAAGSKDKAIRTAQGYDAYYCYYYGYDCCDSDTVEGREACCYYYGTYCDQPSTLGGEAKFEDDYSSAGFAGAGSPRPKKDSPHPLL